RRFMRMDGLMHIEAGYDGDVPVVTMPDGNVYRGDDEKIHSVLSQFVGFPVTLAREEAVSHFDDGPVSLITTSSLRALSERLGDPVDPRRFRANFLVDTEAEGFVEDEWMNQVIRIGSSVTLKIISPITRCVMLNMTRPTLKKDDRILRTLAQCHDARFGVYARVAAGGYVEAGQEVSFLS
ncbi:MAG TPA: MOSC domain-containing protein, partial [Bacillales bacterium]|nr:MOSC domain-containing protein [Bacillales bacterium]